MKLQRLPRALIFDLDNTLVNSDAAYEFALNSLGISNADSGYQEARALVKDRLGPGHVCARNRLLYFKARSEGAGEYAPAKVLALMARYEDALSRHVREQWASLGRAELMKALRSRYRMALLTNENLRTQLLKAQAMDPDGQIFEHLIASEEIGCEKPDPKMFGAVLKRLGVPAQDCLMIGDQLEADLLPALASGMSAALTQEFTAGARQSSDSRVWVVDRLESLRGALLA